MTKLLLLLPVLFLLGACPGQIKVTELDVSIALFEVDGQTSNVPGVPSVEADGCLLILRNAQLLKDIEPDDDSILSNIYMETDDCVFGKKELETNNRELNSSVRREG